MPAASSSTSANVPRVALVYDYFAHYREAVLRELLSDDKHHYVLVSDVRDPCTDPGGTVKTWQALPDGVPAGRFIYTPCRRILNKLLWQKGLLKLAWSREYDVFIFLANYGFISTWLAAIIARLRGARVLMWTHGWTRPENGPKRWVRDLFYRLSHGLLLYGNIARKIGLEHGFEPSRLHVIYNSLDYAEQERLRNSLGEVDVRSVREKFPHPERPLVIATGRLVTRKRIDLLVEALAILNDQGQSMNLLVVGDGPAREALEAQATERGVEARFLGPVYDESELARLLYSADVAVIPGDVGLSAMHAMAYGTPVISHNRPWNQGPEWEAIVPGVTGQHFPPGDAKGLAEALQQWLGANSDREATRRACISVIERCWNPRTQRRLINQAVDGLPAEEIQPATPGHALAC
jgi:glycosyltransferase involved in cell wall biosynthesis